MPSVKVTLAEGVFTEKQKHDMAARLTDVMVASRDGRPSRSKRGRRPDAALIHAVYVQRKAGTVHL